MYNKPKPAIRHQGSGVWHSLRNIDRLPGYSSTMCGLYNVDETTIRSWREVPTAEPICNSYACQYGKSGAY